MGLVFGKLLNSLRELIFSQPRRIVMLGLDSVGKTTILYRLKYNENVTTIPTIGFNVEEIKIGNGSTFIIWDVPGRDKIRELWHHYFRNCHALIYVIDSNEVESLKEAKDALFTILKYEDLSELPVIVIANKQDLPNAMTPNRIADGLELKKLESSHKWHVQPCCAISGDGLYEAMEIVGKLSTEYMKTH